MNNDILSDAKKYKDVQKIEIAGITIFEKKEPVWKSEILSVPIIMIGYSIIGYNIYKKVIK